MFYLTIISTHFAYSYMVFVTQVMLSYDIIECSIFLSQIGLLLGDTYGRRPPTSSNETLGRFDTHTHTHTRTHAHTGAGKGAELIIFISIFSVKM